MAILFSEMGRSGGGARNTTMSGEKYIPPDFCYRDQPSAGPSNPSSNKSTKTGDSSKLDLNPRLKEVLCTNLCLSEQDVERIYSQAASM